MSDQNQIGTARTSRHPGRGCLFWLGSSFAALLGLALVGYIYEPMAEAADARDYPPPGQLVDVGGYRLHINCTGTGSPTVVIDSGLGDWSTNWAWVQPEVAKTTKICTYDRAGSGWSDAGPLPRNAVQDAKELRSLLHKANIAGPYVLVGHSLGGLTVRVFAGMYPSEVAGVVLIESMSPRQFPQSSADKMTFTALARIGPSLARIGLLRLLVRPLGLIPHLPPEVENAFLSRMVRTSNIQAYLRDETQGMLESATQAAAVKTFGDLPLIVLTARLNSRPGWQEWQTELLELSSGSQQLFAENSAHTIQIDEPESAVAAILRMVQQVRETGTRQAFGLAESAV